HTSLPGNSLLAIPNIGDNITIVNITALPNDPTAIVNGTGQQSMDDKNQGVFNFTVKCTAEDGSFTDYPIKIARGPIDIDKDNSLTYIEVSDGEGKNYLGQSNFDTNTTTYGTYHIPFSAQNYTITVVKPGYSPSIVLMDNQTVTSGTRTTTILDSDRGKSKTVTVQVQAQDGTKGTLYTIELMFEAPSSNASLSNLTADGATVPGFNPTDEGGTYTLPTRPYDTQSITIGYEASDPKAQVVGDIGLRPLNVGLNTFTVVVTSESGTAYTYHIHVQRDSEAPYLTNLGATDTKLMDTSYKTTEFKKDVYEYTTIVNYMTLHATINATVDNETHVVACSNSTPIETTGLNRTFNVDLVEGANRFVITVTSLDGKTTEYVFSIKRRNEDSTNTDLIGIEIIQIPSFKTDYTNDVREYPFKEANGTVNNDVTKTLYYSVPNGVRKLNVINVIPEKGPDSDGDGATWEVVNAQGNGMSDGSIDLRVGINTIVIIVTAEDLVSTRAIVVNVERKPMDFTVKTDAYEYECTPQGENVCEIDLVNKRASAIEDYTKYIVFNSEQYAGYDKEIYGDIVGYELELPEVTVVTDISDPNCREVVVRIYDGSEERFVTFKLKSSALNSGFSIPEILQQIMPWILLAIAIIILIIILICVNRDKYGAINKKRKKEPKNQDQNKE
ncbi:MAG: cadherin-like beta sandwich domain-containing protein, partial [Anaeroplasmataceae bacterium]|nr:cadherin-like beta sandwich domain-containing protein [Anaeroplasmataceae bacterium]